MSCDCYCSVTLPQEAVGWSAVCDCGISLSYSLFTGYGALEIANLLKKYAYMNFSDNFLV